MKKLIPLLLALSAIAFYGCSGAGSKDASQEASSQESISQEAAQETVPLIPMARATADDLPPVVLEGEGYHVEIPADEEGIECTPVSEEREAELRQQGYEFIAKPIHVTRNGDNHVELKSAATVRIAIPEDYPKDKYEELVGVLISDNGAEYKIPDYYALQEGYVQFQTCHFSDISAEQKQYELREQFIEKVAVNGWGRNMNNKQVEPKLRDQLDKFAFDFYLGKEDLIGIAMREVFGDNDIVKIGLDIVNAYDLEVATFEQRAEVASQTMIRVAESKLLAYFLDKLKEEETKKIRVEDELRSEKIGEKVYKTEMAEIESKRNKIIGVLEDHFGIDNVEQVSTMVGKQASTEEWFIYACEYIGKFALDKWKETVVNMVPYIGYLQQMATAVEIWKKFWAATEMQTLYEEYKNLADEQGGLMSPDDWTTVSRRVKAPEFLHGMKDEKIKEMIEKRYREQKEIEQRKVELREYLAIIESTVNMNHPVFLLKNFDYVQRLTVINNLMDRFRSELVTKDGYLYCYENGEMKQLIHPHAVNRQLCEVVSRYLDFYPDRDAFNEWMSKNGYNYDPLKQRFKRLDALLWNEKAKKEPDIHIVIQESMGAESGIPKYMNHTVCLGKDGKPYKKWYRDIPDNDTIRYEGWAVEYPDEDEYIKLSAYDALGWPNQVLIYGNTGDMLLGKKPVKIVPFEVDTTNSSTYVELNEDAVVLTDFYHNRFAVDPDGVFYPQSVMGPDGKEIYLDRTTMIYAALNNALEDVHIFINLYGKNNNFSFSVSGSCDENDESAEIELTVSGHMDFDKKNEYAKNVEVGTCAIKGTMSGVNRQGVQIKCRFNLTGKIRTNGWKNGENYHIKCRATGPLEYESVNTKGKRKAATVEGSSIITFREYYDPHAYEDDEEE